MLSQNSEYETDNEKFRKVYEVLNSNSKKFGKFHKSIFHLHTPASHDYRLYTEKDNAYYTGLSDNDIFLIAKSENLFQDIPFDDITDIPLDSIYVNYKEYFTYLLIAQKLIEHNIGLVLITDHNTISGYDKLTKAIDIYCKGKIIKIYPEVILGIEISCGDKNHIVGIFDNTERSKGLINKWLETNIMTQKDGTYLTSYDVVDAIKNEMNGFPYIAHINSSDVFKDKYLSLAYKKRLFDIEGFNTIGVSDIKYISYIEGKIRKFRNDDIRFVLDSDSHAIDDINKSIFWIKGETCNFKMIKDAIRDYNISMEFESPKQPNSYIKGLWVEGNGFLGSNEKNNPEPFWITFTESLNCFIGGKGTGKSSILVILEFLLSQRISDKKSLEMVCSYDSIYLLYSLNGDDFLIGFYPPYYEYRDDDILKYFEEATRINRSYKHKFQFNPKEIAEYTLSNYISIMKIINKGKDFELKIINSNKLSLMKKFFNKRYSINDLVNIAGSDELNNYIYETISKNNDISKIRFRKLKSNNEIQNIKNKVSEIKRKRFELIHLIIGKYNEKHKHQLKIVYTQGDLNSELDWEQVLIPDESDRKSIRKFNISEDNIIDFMYSLNKELHFIDIIELFKNRKYDQISHIKNIIEFAFEVDFDQVERFTILNESNKEVILNYIRKNLLNNSVYVINDMLEEYFANLEYFSLQFNINNKENREKKNDLFRDVAYLSQGQKVVAMLSFVLSYSEFTNDKTPLIIDQPEDNLDNSYIYKNLVNKLREVKSLRQIIIATHSSTIVTNAKAEQVIVLESDNRNGWVKCKGYPAKSTIVMEIINHLEGGNDSFVHKYYLYKDYLRNN
ncbi:Spaf_1101 family AAA-like ATPase [Sinanaerobacter chloroacetimidivorans]|uniref:AAA family ATPase n=1 Tax=Sinanaerobacter chloroacetimidivorans TaxID=2818044 RepID=A0A8J7VZP2_9FIRM|nr:chromosome segregation protein SMC [Sinanaerobacter chloroacetimidivorans]MBR0598107.1 AAA family ATPase [Sinanaerobacter chloroacetimidivorans]